MEPLVPFLVEKANAPVEDEEQQVEMSNEVGEQSSPSWSTFHTRCGHPRHRDD